MLHLLFDFLVRMHRAVATQVRQIPISCMRDNAPNFANKDICQGADWPLLTGAEGLEVLGTHKETGLVTCRLVFATINEYARNVEGSVATFDIGDLKKGVC